MEKTVKTIFFAFVILLVCTCSSKAQSVLIPELIEASSTRAGNNLIALFVDSRGFVWAGTMVDLIRYDGFSIKRYSYETNAYEGELIITSITEDPDGNIWCSSKAQGLLVLPFSKNGFGQLSLPTLKGTMPTSKTITCDKEGNIWGVTINAELFLLSKSDSSVYTWPLSVMGSIQSFLIDKNGGIWYILGGGGIYYCKTPVPNKKLEAIKHFDGIVRDAVITDDEIYFCNTLSLYKISKQSDEKYIVGQLATLPQKRGNTQEIFLLLNTKSTEDFLLATTTNSRLLFINKKTGKIEEPVFENLNTSRTELISFQVVSNRLIYIGTNKGLLRTTVGNKAITRHKHKTNLRFRSVVALGTDTLLLGTKGYGIYRYVKSNDGKWNNDKQEHLNLASLVQCNTVNRFYTDKTNTLWATTNCGLFKRTKGGWELVVKGMQVWGITEDDEGNLWLGNNFFGLLKYNPKTGQSKRLWMEKKADENQADKHYKLIWQTKYYNGKIYLATAAGLLEFDIKTEKFKVFFNNQLKLVPTWDFYISDSLWLIPTQGKGLWSYNPTTKKLENVDATNQFLYSMVQDGSGSFWMINDKGVLKYQWPLDVSSFTLSDGLNTDLLSYTGIAKLGKTQVVFCGEDGFTIADIDGDGVNNGAKENSLFVSSLKYAGIAISDYLDSTASLSLDFAKGQLLIECATNYIFPRKATLHYLLEGEDKDWNTTVNGNNAINYTNLAPGTYIFKAYISGKGIKRSKIFKLKIIINPPFWRTAWFNGILIIVLASLLVYIIYDWAIRQKLKQDKLKSEIEALRAQINPHFIFNALNSIQSFIYLENKAEANEYLVKFSKLMRMILENSREEIITVHQERGFLALYLEMEKIRFKGKFNFSIHNSHEGNIKYKIPAMLLQPIVENALKYGVNEEDDKLTIDINFEIEDNAVVCEVMDNGKGFVDSNVSTNTGERHSLGLTLVKERLQTLSKIYKTEYKIIIGNRSQFNKGNKGAYVKLIIPQHD